MRLLTAAIALATTVCLSTSSLAAVVQQVQGQVLINTGMGYRAIQTGATVNPGAIVVARPGGSAQVIYSDGCAVPVSAGNPVHRVEVESPCVRGGFDYSYYVVPGLALAGIGTAIILVAEDDDDDAPASP